MLTITVNTTQQNILNQWTRPLGKALLDMEAMGVNINVVIRDGDTLQLAALLTTLRQQLSRIE